MPVTLNKSTENSTYYVVLLRYDASANTYTSCQYYAGADIYKEDATVGECFYVGLRRANYGHIQYIPFSLGTPMAGTYTIVPEYYNGSAWVELVDYYDGTKGFTQSGNFYFDNSKQSGQIFTTVSGVNMQWIRFRLSSITSLTEGGKTSGYVSVISDKIVIEDYTSASPASSADCYAADISTPFNIYDGDCGTGITPVYNMRPAEEREIKVDFILSGTSAGAGDTLDITGVDQNGNTVSESIDVSSGDGTYTTVYKYANITNVDCTGWSDGNLIIQQYRYGVVWNIDKWYRFDRGFVFLNTYFTEKNSSWYLNPNIWAMGNGDSNIVNFSSVVTFGAVANADKKSTNNGVQIYCDNEENFMAFYYTFYGSSSGLVKHYGTQIAQFRRGDATSGYRGTDEQDLLWNCCWNDGAQFGMDGDSNVDISNCMTINNSVGVRRPSPITEVDGFLTIFPGGGYGVWYQNAGGTAKNVRCRGGGYAVRMESIPADTNAYVIDMDTDAWAINWAGTVYSNSRIYRQYTINLTLVDENNNPISGATVIMKDKDGTELFSVTTDANGQIEEQVVSRGYCTSPDANLDTSLTADYSPHMLIIKRSGYKTYQSKFTLSEKFNEVITLERSPYTRMGVRPR